MTTSEPLDLTEIEDRAEREYLSPCPDGCGCVYADDGDRHECACDGPCGTDAWYVDTEALRRPEGGERSIDTTALADEVRRLRAQNDTAREVVGYVVAGIGDDFRQGFCEPMIVYDTRDGADGQLVQMWADGFDDHEVFELTRFTTRLQPPQQFTPPVRPIVDVHLPEDS